jgi:Protein of unknown function (DUF3572)
MPLSAKPAQTDPQTLALRAAAFVLGDDRLRQRFMDLCGIEPAELRASLADTETLRAFLSFLCAHEPDLLACAQSLGEKPEALQSAAQNLEPRA